MDRLEVLLGFFIGALAYGSFRFAYWAQWEKLAWYWTKTDMLEELRRSGTSHPPEAHRYIASIVGCFWGLLGLIVTIVLWASVATVANVF
jgi:hypothetical protein